MSYLKFMSLFLLSLFLFSYTCESQKEIRNNVSTEERRKNLDPKGVNFLMNAQTAYEQGAYRVSLAYTDSVMQYDPRLADLYFLRGRIYTAMQHYDNAVRSYNKVLELDAEYKGTRFNLGNLMFMKGENRQAIDLYQEESKLYPASRVYVQLGRAYSKAGKVDSAAIAYNEAVNLDSTNASAYMWFGQLYEDEGELEKALPYSRKGLSLQPDNMHYRYIVGSELHRTGRTEEAIDLLTDVVQELPHHAGAHYNLGQALVKSGNKEKGSRYLTIADSLQKVESDIEELESLAKMNPDEVMNWVKLGDAYKKSDQLEQALRAYKTALYYAPWNYALQNNIADLTVSLGDTAQGIERYISILKQNPNLPDVWLNLGVAYANSGRYDDARWAWNRALKYDPDYTLAKEYLSRLAEEE